MTPLLLFLPKNGLYFPHSLLQGIGESEEDLLPEPERRYRWGLLGTGAIAGQFAVQLARAECADLYAVGSRTGERARTFAAEYGFRVGHEGY